VRKAVSGRGEGAASDAELLAAMRADPARALGALYDRYARVVYGLAQTMLANATEAEDLTQDVFLALCNENRYDPARGSLAAYLVTMTRSRAIDRLRVRGRSQRLFDPTDEAVGRAVSRSAPADEVSVQQCGVRVREAVAQLPDDQRRVLELAYYTGLSQVEIADETGLPLGTVKTWTRKGLLALRARLGDLLR
jgi:RNA polymerase sigma-70 factor (ECF subfamily)